MRRKYYRYSNWKFWGLLVACLAVLSGSTTYHFVSISRYEAQTRRDFTQAVGIILKTAEMFLVMQQRNHLVLLAEQTVGKLQLAQYEQPPALAEWLDTAFTRHLTMAGTTHALAIYDIDGQRQYQVGQSDCLMERFSMNRFCVEAGQPAILLSLPIYGLTGERFGDLSAIVPIPRDMLQQAGRDFGVKITLAVGSQQLYEDSGIPIHADHINLRIHPPDMRKEFLDPAPQRLLTRRGLWYVYAVALGREGDPDAIMFCGYRNGNIILWRTLEALGINILLTIAMAVFFVYFHINYKYISHTYRAVIDGMDDFLAYKDTSRQYQMINMKMATTLFQRHPKDVIGHTDAELGMPLVMREQCAMSDEEVLTTRSRVHLIESGYTADGRILVLDILKTPFFHESGKFGGVVVCGRDIAEQQQLQAALDELEDSYFSSEWILAKLMQTMPEFIYLKDREHRFIRASQSVCDFYGLPDVTGLTDYDMYAPEIAQGFWEAEEAILCGREESYTRTEQAIAPDGTRRHILTTKTIFRDKRGAIAGLLGIGRDVTAIVDENTAYKLALAESTQLILQQVARMRKQTDTIEVAL